MISLLGLSAGFVLLVYGASWFVTGASGLAKRLGVPSVIIGLTVVAFGTSAPELAVSVTASLQGANEIALGNVLGSNLFNLLAVVGASAVIAPLAVDANLLHRDWRASIAATALCLAFAFANGEISRLDAACLLVFFLSVLLLQINAARTERNAISQAATLPQSAQKTVPSDVATANVCDYTAAQACFADAPSVTQTEQNTNTPTLAPLKILGYSVVGLACIVAGGQCSVTAASAIARQFGLSESLIGLTIVAIGTSLPELVTSVVATKRGETDIAVGNVIGSNLFNILFILGTACLICPIPANIFVALDTLLLLVASVVLYFVAKKNGLTRGVGVLLLLVYLGYAAWVVVR